jgi:hypothetical protein
MSQHYVSFNHVLTTSFQGKSLSLTADFLSENSDATTALLTLQEILSTELGTRAFEMLTWTVTPDYITFVHAYSEIRVLLEQNLPLTQFARKLEELYQSFSGLQWPSKTIKERSQELMEKIDMHGKSKASPTGYQDLLEEKIPSTDDIYTLKKMQHILVDQLQEVVYNIYRTSFEWQQITELDQFKEWKEGILAKLALQPQPLQIVTSPSIFDRKSTESQNLGLDNDTGVWTDDFQDKFKVKNKIKKKLEALHKRQLSPERKMNLANYGGVDISVEGATTSESEMWDTGDEMAPDKHSPITATKLDSAKNIAENAHDDQSAHSSCDLYIPVNDTKSTSAFQKVKKRLSQRFESAGSFMTGGCTSSETAKSRGLKLKKPFDILGNLMSSGKNGNGKHRMSFSSNLILSDNEGSGSDHDDPLSKSNDSLNCALAPAKNLTNRRSVQRASQDTTQYSPSDVSKHSSQASDIKAFISPTEDCTGDGSLSDLSLPPSPDKNHGYNGWIPSKRQRYRSRQSIDSEKRMSWTEKLTGANKNSGLFSRSRQCISESEEETSTNRLKSLSMEELQQLHLSTACEVDTSSDIEDSGWREKVFSVAGAERSETPLSVTEPVPRQLTESLASLAPEEMPQTEMMLPSLSTPRIIELEDALEQIRQEYSVLEEKIALLEQEPNASATKERLRNLQLMRVGLDVEIARLCDEKKRCTVEELENLILPVSIISFLMFTQSVTYFFLSELYNYKHNGC